MLRCSTVRKLKHCPHIEHGQRFHIQMTFYLLTAQTLSSQKHVPMDSRIPHQLNFQHLNRKQHAWTGFTQAIF